MAYITDAIMWNLALPFLRANKADDYIAFRVSKILEGPPFNFPPNTLTVDEWRKLVSRVGLRLLPLVEGTPGYSHQKEPRGDITSASVLAIFDSVIRATNRQLREIFSKEEHMANFLEDFCSSSFIPANIRRDYRILAADMKDSVARQKRISNMEDIDLDELGLGDDKEDKA